MTGPRRSSASSDRVICQTASRPLRLAVVVESDHVAVFRRVVRMLCSVWGGTNSIIITGSEAEPIHPRWHRTIRAFDPDAILFQATRRPKRRGREILTLAEQLDGTPIWVSELRDGLELQLGWWPVRSVHVDPSPTSLSSADRIPGATPIEVAVLGLAGASLSRAEQRRGESKELRDVAATTSLVAGSPAGQAGIGVARLRARTAVTAPFLYYTAPSVETARLLWNLRALHGAVVHGGDWALAAHANLLRRAGRDRLQVVHATPLTSDAHAVLTSVARAIVTPVSRAPWPRRWYRPLGGGADSEIEEVPLVDGIAQIPRRPPAVRTPHGTVEISETRGVYALEVDLMLAGTGRRVSLPPRSGLTNALVTRSTALMPTRLFGFTTASRVSQGPTVVVAVRPGRWGRTIPLRVPGVTEVFNRIADSVEFELSDKGHFARWLADRLQGLSGIHALMTDPRGGVLMKEFLLHHSGGASTGAYRRSLNVVEMRSVFRRERQAGNLPRRMSPPDEDWLDAWLEWLMRAGVLKLGIRAKCSECLWGSLITLGHFSETFSCPRCGAAHLVPANPTLAYHLAEAAHQFLANRADVTALALGALQRRSRVSFSADFDHAVTLSSGGKREIDFLAVMDGNVVIGEAKATGKFNVEDFALMRRLAASVRPRLIVLATDTECEGGCGQACGGSRMLGASSDSALPKGSAAAPGPRERLVDLRNDVWKYRTHVVALCRGEMSRPRGPEREFVAS